MNRYKRGREKLTLAFSRFYCGAFCD